MSKKYSQNDIYDKFRKRKCLECIDGELIGTGRSPDGGWVEYYECNNCGTKYEFQESDMGQTLPFLKSNA